MKQTDCKHCLQLGRTEPKNRCAICHYCKEHVGCHCVSCPICRKRVAPTLVCKKCQRCRAHHTEIIHGDFPFRKCEYKNVPVKCNCRDYEGYTTCKVCRKCLHGCLCPPTFALNPLQRALGCELEIAEYNGFDQHPHSDIPIIYQFDHDGSVQPSGRELVTAKLIGDKAPRGMAALADVLAKYGASVNETCGFHVHVDALHDSAADLRRILVGFKLFQDQIFGTLVAPERKDNQYCPPLALLDSQIFDLMQLDSSAAINRWFYKYLYNITSPEVGSLTAAQRRGVMQEFDQRIMARKEHKYDNSARRSAINFHSWMMRGTVEFRCKEGSIEKSDLVNWPLWCGWFVQKFAGLTDKEILWWMKKPPSLVELSERFCATSLGGARMPKSVLEWVASRVATPPKVKKKLVQAGARTPPAISTILDELAPQLTTQFRDQLYANLQNVNSSLSIGGSGQVWSSNPAGLGRSEPVAAPPPSPSVQYDIFEEPEYDRNDPF